MARKLQPEMTLETFEDETLFTRSALKADTDACDLLSMTDSALPSIDQVRAADRALRENIGDTDASRIVANQRLDMECITFGRDLLYEVGNDRSSPRWTGFFKVSPHLFVRKPLAEQEQTVESWLIAPSDPVLEKHRPNLTTWQGSAHTALVKTSALANLRAQQWQARIKLASDLTKARDALHRALGERADARGLPREWADIFFRTETRSEPKSAKDESATASTPPSDSAGAAGTGGGEASGSGTSASAPSTSGASADPTNG